MKRFLELIESFGCKASIENNNSLSLWEREQLCEQSEHTTAGEGAMHVVLSNNSCQSLVCYSGGATQAVHDIENLCKTRVSDGTATLPPHSNSLPDGARGQEANPLSHRRGSNLSVSGSQEMHSRRGQSGVHEMLKLVQHDINIFLKRTYSLINLFSYSPRKCAAFTLAEVLITLGIIGVVAAMTIPSVVGNYQKQKTISYVKKFYSDINNAVRMSAAYNGDVELWLEDYRQDNYSANLKFLQEYILPYIKYLRVENCNGQRACVYLPYGMFTYRVDSNGGDIAFFVNSKYERFPKNYFVFQLNKKNNNPSLANRPTVEPYAYSWNGDYNPPVSNTLKTSGWGGCNTNAGDDAKYAYCTKWIQLNNWEVPDDYPWNAKE